MSSVFSDSPSAALLKSTRRKKNNKTIPEGDSYKSKTDFAHVQRHLLLLSQQNQVWSKRSSFICYSDVIGNLLLNTVSYDRYSDLTVFALGKF